MSKMGQRPSTHTGELSGETHGFTHILYISFSKRMPTPDLRPWDVGGGVAPIPTFCPYRARYLLNPGHGGTQGVVHSVHFTLG